MRMLATRLRGYGSLGYAIGGQVSLPEADLHAR